MAFIGTPLDTRNTFQSLVGKRFNGDGSETEFTLDVAPSSVLDIEVFVGNVRQDPNSAYTLSGTTLTFTGAPPSGTNNIYVVHQAKSVGTIDVPSSFTSSAQTFSGGLTSSGAFTSVGIDDNGDATTMTIDTSENVNIGDATNRGFGPVQMGNASTAQAYLQMLSSTAGNIHFGDATSGDARFIGSIVYRHDTNLMKFQTNGATGLQIDSAGHVTKPKNPAFRLVQSSSGDYANGHTAFTSNTTEQYDVNSDLASNGTFTAPVTGTYLFTIGIADANSTDDTSYDMRLITSNRDYRWGIRNKFEDNTTGITTMTVKGSVLVDMDANDTASVQVATSVTITIEGNVEHSFFSGVLIG